MDVGVFDFDVLRGFGFCFGGGHGVIVSYGGVGRPRALVASFGRGVGTTGWCRSSSLCGGWRGDRSFTEPVAFISQLFQESAKLVSPAMYVMAKPPFLLFRAFLNYNT